MHTAPFKTAQKEFKFEAAHRLINYPGKCKNLHGHSYVAKVTLCLIPDATYNDYGFVKDYADFKSLKNWIDENLDHSTIVSKHDTALTEILTSLQSKKYVLEYPNSSAEYICELLFSKAKQFLEDERTYVLKVSVNETCTSEATISL